MEPARSTVTAQAGPRAALRVMRDLQTSAVFVLDSSRRLIGVVRDREVLDMVRAGKTDFGGVLSHDAVTIAPDAVVSELFIPAVESPLPLAVVDEAQRLVGVVPRVTLLAALGNVPHDTGEFSIVDPPATVPIDIVTDALDQEAAR